MRVSLYIIQTCKETGDLFMYGLANNLGRSLLDRLPKSFGLVQCVTTPNTAGGFIEARKTSEVFLWHNLQPDRYRST